MCCVTGEWSPVATSYILWNGVTNTVRMQNARQTLGTVLNWFSYQVTCTHRITSGKKGLPTGAFQLSRTIWCSRQDWDRTDQRRRSASCYNLIMRRKKRNCGDSVLLQANNVWFCCKSSWAALLLSKGNSMVVGKADRAQQNWGKNNQVWRIHDPKRTRLRTQVRTLDQPGILT